MQLFKFALIFLVSGFLCGPNVIIGQSEPWPGTMEQTIRAAKMTKPGPITFMPSETTIEQVGKTIPSFSFTVPQTVTWERAESSVTEVCETIDKKEVCYLDIRNKHIHLKVWPCGKVEKEVWKELNQNEERGNQGTLRLWTVLGNLYLNLN